MKKCLLFVSMVWFAIAGGFAITTVTLPSLWLMGDTFPHCFEYGVLHYSSPYTGNVNIPPYYYETALGSDYERRCVIVSAICGSSHDGTWVHAPKHSPYRGLFVFDGPFLNADIDTLRLPHTIGRIGQGGFENGKIKVLILGAAVPPIFEAEIDYPVFEGKLIVPAGSLQAYQEHEVWSKFSRIEEGAETYFPAQMVQTEGAWYELYQGEAKLIDSKSANVQMVIPDEVTYQSVAYPVTLLGISSVYKYKVKSLTLGANVRSFSFECMPKITSDIERNTWYAELDSIFVAPENPYFSSVGGALYTKDFKELVFLPLSRNSLNSRKWHTLPLGAKTINDNAIDYILRNEDPDNSRWITVVIPFTGATIGTQHSNKWGKIYLIDKIPDILPLGQTPVFAADATAYWLSDESCYDLQLLNVRNQSEYTFEPWIDYGPMTGRVRTIGKYCLNQRDTDLPMFGYRWGSSAEPYFNMDNKNSLKSFKLGEGVEEIYGLFRNCTTLTDVSLPRSLRVLGCGTFNGCTALEKVTIPENVNTVGSGTFANCQSLRHVFIKNATPPAFFDEGFNTKEEAFQMKNVFRNVPSYVVLHVPMGAKQAYMEASVWKDFGSIVDDVESGISVVTEDMPKPTDVWSADGRKGIRRGLNVVRYSDGTTRKRIM